MDIAVAGHQIAQIYGGYAPYFISPERLAGYWNLNKGSGNVVNDISGSGNDGTLLNGAVWRVDVP